MFWKKKEKPILEEGLIAIGEKALYTQKFIYIPTKIATFKDRIEFSINRFVAEGEWLKPVTFTAVAQISDDRLLPFTVEDETLYWDTFDRAFRMKVLPEGEAQALIPPVLLYPNEVMTMEREFAEKNFSELALSYATKKDDTYIWYYADGSAAPVVYEAPRLFCVFNEYFGHPLSANPFDVRNNMLVFANGYLDANGIIEDNFLDIFRENKKKGKTEE